MDGKTRQNLDNLILVIIRNYKKSNYFIIKANKRLLKKARKFT